MEAAVVWPILDRLLVIVALACAAAFVVRRFVLRTKTMGSTGPATGTVQVGPRLAAAMKRREAGKSR